LLLQSYLLPLLAFRYLMYSFLPARSLLFRLLYWKLSAKRNLFRSMLPTVTASTYEPITMPDSTSFKGLAFSEAKELKDVTMINAAAIVFNVVFICLFFLMADESSSKYSLNFVLMSIYISVSCL